MKRTPRSLLAATALLGIVLLSGACEFDDGFRRRNISPSAYYEPVYMSEAEAKRIESLPPRPLERPGKIYVKGHILFINEIGEGLHIFDNTEPSNPLALAFLRIPGNVDIAVRGNTMYADNMNDLLALDISEPQQIKVLQRVSHALPQNLNFPPEVNVIFDCPDATKGVIVGWKKVDENKNFKCYR
jgi:hypothetical protein